MARTLSRTLIVLLVATTTPRAAFAQSTPSAQPTPSSDNLTAQDRDVLAAAEQLASNSSQVIEQWITSQVTTEDRVFARLYFPIAKTDPQKYSTPYDALAERDIVGLEDKVLVRAPTIQYAVLTDSNGYIPAHNSRFAQPLTGNTAQDYVNNRSKRILGDVASLLAARSEVRYLLQRTRLDTGDVVYDLSVPVVVRGKHWGCARIGYRRTE
ncbi:MAG TPA: hypothetical protein VGD37_36680 [Kofleriaceae bacterium]